ncbi:MAG TPA: class F sortase, partial [Actinomycetota bacterium]|nr:class F sortase [Actinomycetota bacterium]
SVTRPAPPPPKPARPAAFPTRGRVRIPSVAIEGPVVSTVVKDRDMVIPPNSRDVAWLDHGSYPGPYRNVILAGHRSWGGRQGTLWRLGEVKEGDEVWVEVDGAAHGYRVKWVRLYHPDNAPVEEIMGETPVHSVTLITCGGNFDQARRRYDQRIVVRAEALS